jgi:hypothetical protein
MADRPFRSRIRRGEVDPTVTMPMMGQGGSMPTMTLGNRPSWQFQSEEERQREMKIIADLMDFSAMPPATRATSNGAPQLGGGTSPNVPRMQIKGGPGFDGHATGQFPPVDPLAGMSPSAFRERQAPGLVGEMHQTLEDLRTGKRQVSPEVQAQFDQLVKAGQEDYWRNPTVDRTKWGYSKMANPVPAFPDQPPQVTMLGGSQPPARKPFEVTPEMRAQWDAVAKDNSFEKVHDDKGKFLGYQKNAAPYEPDPDQQEKRRLALAQRKAVVDQRKQNVVRKNYGFDVDTELAMDYLGGPEYAAKRAALRSAEKIASMEDAARQADLEIRREAGRGDQDFRAKQLDQQTELAKLQAMYEEGAKVRHGQSEQSAQQRHLEQLLAENQRSLAQIAATTEAAKIQAAGQNPPRTPLDYAGAGFAQGQPTSEVQSFLDTAQPFAPPQVQGGGGPQPVSPPSTGAMAKSLGLKSDRHLRDITESAAIKGNAKAIYNYLLETGQYTPAEATRIVRNDAISDVQYFSPGSPGGWKNMMLGGWFGPPPTGMEYGGSFPIYKGNKDKGWVPSASGLIP